MASFLRKLVISMLIPYLWHRWRDRDRSAATDVAGRTGTPAPGAAGTAPQAPAGAPPHGAPTPR